MLHLATLDKYVFNTFGSPQLSGTPFSVTVKAVDVNGATITSYNGSATLSLVETTGGVTVYSDSLTFVSVVCTHDISLTRGSGNTLMYVQISLSDGYYVRLSNIIGLI